MTRLAIEFLDQGLHRVIFDAMPLPVFVVDEDVTILEYNSAAARFLDRDKGLVLQRKNGEILHCIHAAEAPEGCGRSKACSGCVVRQAVHETFRGRHSTRQAAQMELKVKGKARKVNLRVSTSPLAYKGQAFALLVLEGLND